VLDQQVTIYSKAKAISESFSYYGASANPLIGFIIIPPALCYMLPVFVFAIVLERSNKTLELSKLVSLNLDCSIYL
jgi:hypothetical protein